MPWSLIGVGLALTAAGVAWQIIADWRRHGLTHLRYLAAMLYVVGAGLLTWLAYQYGHPVLGFFTGAPGLLAIVAVWVKVRDTGRARRWWR